MNLLGAQGISWEPSPALGALLAGSDTREVAWLAADQGRETPRCWAGGNSEGVLVASPVTRYRSPAALLSECILAREPGPTQMLFPFTLDRRCPVVRRGARGLCLLPARPSDDRELPAVPSAQSLEVRWPLHEFYKRGKSMICNHNCFPLTQNFPSRSSRAAQRAGPGHVAEGLGRYGVINTPPRGGTTGRKHRYTPC